MDNRQSIFLEGENGGGLIIDGVYYGKLYSSIKNYYLYKAYDGLRDYINGNLPRKSVIGDYGLITIYFREMGYNDKDGRTKETALKNLTGAVQLVKSGERINIIDCSNTVLGDEVCDFEGINKKIEIIGTDSLVLSSGNGGLTLKNAKSGVILNQFSSINRIIADNSRVRSEER